MSEQLIFFVLHGLAKQGKYTRCLVAGLSEKQSQWRKVSIMNKGIPKETNPPLVLRSSKGSPLSSGGGMGDQVHGGALDHFSELPTSMSSYCKRKRGEANEDTMFFFKNNEKRISGPNQKSDDSLVFANLKEGCCYNNI